jgi:NitT/TauT family transport system permease protein
VLGVLLATLLVSSPFMRRLLNPLLAGIQAVPKNALAPIFVLWFGGGELSKIAITFLISFFPIVINTVSGMTLVDRDMIYLTRTLRASPFQTFVHVRIPNAVPALFAACKIAITLAVVGAVIGEFVGADEGLGYLIMVESSQLRTDVAFVAIVLLGLCGVLLFAIVEIIEANVVPWLVAPSAEDAHEHAT